LKLSAVSKDKCHTDVFGVLRIVLNLQLLFSYQ